MKHHIFTDKERAELESNPNISKVLNSNVEYTQAFKEKALYEHTELGKSAKQIFQEAGIPDWLNQGEYAKSSLKRWCKRGVSSASTKRGRPKVTPNKPLNEMTMEELRKRVAYLELENEFLKKLEPLEQYKNQN